MIIQSNTMHTNARRTYRSSETSITNTTRWDNSGATIFSMHDAQSRQESIYTESHNGQKDTGNGNASMNANEDSKGDTMDDLMQRFLSTPNVHRNNLQSNISSIQKIRQQATIFFIFYLEADTMNRIRQQIPLTQHLSLIPSPLLQMMQTL